MLPLPKSPLLRYLLLAAVVLAIGLAARQRLLGESLPAWPVVEGELRQSIVASGRVRTPQRIEMSAQLAGRVVAVAVREGDAVTPGQVLLRLDDAELKAARAQAQAGLGQSEARLRQVAELARPVAEQGRLQAEANWQQAKKQYERTRELVNRGFYSPAQLDEAGRALAVAESQLKSGEAQVASNRPEGADAQAIRAALDQARATLALAEARLAYASLSAPLAGRVLTRNVEPGDTVQQGKTLLVLAPEAETELTVQIDEKNIGLLALGQTARVSADAYPQQNFAATVNYIAPAVDAQRGSVEVRLRVPEPPAYLKNEMTVSIDIDTARRASALQIPAEALRDASSAAPWVMVVREGVAQKQVLRLGVRGKGRVEVLEGLAAGELVLPASLAVAEGRRVRAAVNPEK
ncbi:MAG: efflux RND transporter periplasmic adaptor subunit [Dechloromonas sp.]|nr:MAG: efflux RND transporter periplasmic adaptor subunit [Dechloromonas sp.]